MRLVTTKGGEKQTIRRTSRLISDLVTGKVHDAKSARAVLGVTGDAAARNQLKVIASAMPSIRVIPGKPRRYKFDRSQLKNRAELSTAIAACFGASLGSLFSGTIYESSMKEFRDVIHGLNTRSSEFRDIERKFVFLAGGGESSLPDRATDLDELCELLLKQVWLTLDYEHFDGAKETIRVQPYSLVVYSHQLHLVGRRQDGTLHPFRFSRIKRIEEESAHFEYPQRTEYDPEQLFSHSIGVFIGDKFPPQEVQVRLSSRWKNYARTHRWHRHQRVEFSSEGVLLKLTVRVCPELEAWILGFGEEAEVLSPPTLRETIRSRVQRAAGVYAKTS